MVDYSNTQVEELKEQLSETIKKEIERQGLSQSQVGKKAGMGRININKTIHGTEKGISINQLVRIANAIDLDIRLIIKRKTK